MNTKRYYIVVNDRGGDRRGEPFDNVIYYDFGEADKVAKKIAFGYAKQGITKYVAVCCYIENSAFLKSYAIKK